MLVLGLGAGMSACTDTLTEPRSEVTSANIFTDTTSYTRFLAKLYGGLAVSGQQGPAGNNDIRGIDEGFGQYIRGYWQMQVLPTDEAVIGWGDAGLPQLVQSTWSPSNQFTTAMYYRIFYQVSLANEFLRETTSAKLAERGHEGIQGTIDGYRAEARFLRALSYWHAIDLFGSVPFYDESFTIGNTPPQQGTRQEIFNFIESELLAIRAELPAAGDDDFYGRANQAAADMLLAKLYLNAEVYGAGNRYADAMAAAEDVIESGAYDLASGYNDNFGSDNHTSPEIVFAVPFDSDRTQTWGGTTFLVAAAIIGSLDAADFGTTEKWSGLRLTQQIVALYEDGADGPDERSDIIHTAGQDSIVEVLGTATDGYAFPKYTNVPSSGIIIADEITRHPDTDYPMFRLADAYLIFAEACLQSGGGACETEALGYVNEIRERAYGNTSGNITAGELTLDFILDERGRELIWEATRRQDLIRYGLFTGGEYLWAFKGGSAAGVATLEHLDLYPIPSTDLLANPNLDQNPGY